MKIKKKACSIILIITFTGFAFSGVLAQSLNSSTFTKIYFDNFEALSGDRFLITQLSGDVLAQIYNSKNKKVEQDLIRSGRGPFELEYMGGMVFNRQTKKLYAIDFQNGKIICFDEQGTPIKEKYLKITYARKMDAFRDELSITPGTHISKATPNRNKYPLTYLLNPNTLKISDTLFFNLDELKLEKIKDFDKLNYFDLRPLAVSSYRKGLYLVVFESFNKIFLINKNSEIIDKIEIDVNNIKTPKIVKHPSFGYGQRTYTLLNDYVRKGESIYFTFGQDSKGIRKGLIEVKINDKNKLSTQKHLLKTKLELTDSYHLYKNPYQVTGDDITIYGADGIDIIPLTFD